MKLQRINNKKKEFENLKKYNKMKVKIRMNRNKKRSKDVLENKMTQ